MPLHTRVLTTHASWPWQAIRLFRARFLHTRLRFSERPPSSPSPPSRHARWPVCVAGSRCECVPVGKTWRAWRHGADALVTGASPHCHARHCSLASTIGRFAQKRPLQLLFLACGRLVMSAPSFAGTRAASGRPVLQTRDAWWACWHRMEDDDDGVAVPKRLFGPTPVFSPKWWRAGTAIAARACMCMHS